MNDNEYILQINRGRFGYLRNRQENILLDEVSVNLRRGELVCLVGKNGSGKTTLLKTLMKLSPLPAGEILLLGRKLEHYQPAELAQNCSFVPTALADTGEMTVRELAELGRYPYTNWYGKLSRQDHSIVDAALSATGISGMARKRLHEISDGEKQRTMIARSLAQDTPLILLDEPSAFLDIQGKYEITSLLRQLCMKQHSAVFSTHDLNLALQYADKIWLIAGKKMIQGAPEDLIINNRIGDLFHSDQIRFDSSAGEFKPVIEYRGNVMIRNLTASPAVFEWTRKALRRAGFSSESPEKDSGPVITIDHAMGKHTWRMETRGGETMYESLYDLLLDLAVHL